MRKKILLILFGTMFALAVGLFAFYKYSGSIGQTPATVNYIPKDLDDCIAVLEKSLPAKTLKEMKAGKEKDMNRYHRGVGMGLRNNWGLWGGSRLAKYFISIGIYHPDDMSGVIFKSLWRHLNGKPIQLERQVKYYQFYWKVRETPKILACPTCGSKLIINSRLRNNDVLDWPSCIHVGYCKDYKHLWVYEYRRGWYKPDEMLKERIKEHTERRITDNKISGKEGN